MSSFSSVTSNLSGAASTLTSATRQVLNGAAHPLKAARLMGRLVQRSAQKPGTAPGSLVHSGPKKMEKVRLRLFEYDADEIKETELSTVDEAFPIRDDPPVGWLNVDGLHDPELLRKVRDYFDLHLLLMEDVVTVDQRPKMDEYPGCLYLLVPMLSFHSDTLTVQSEQLSLILGPTWVLTFQEREGDVFEPVRERIRSASGRIRSRGADYLAYALLDAVVDRYFVILEKLGDVTEEMEPRVLADPIPRTLQQINHLKRELLLMRKAVWPLREVLNAFGRTESPLVEAGSRAFIRDVYDHAVHVIDTVETLRDLASGMTDLYLSSVGQKTNEVMKVLTLVATIFIPLTFLAGVYGMNFEFMPELKIRWAYPALWGVMLLVAGGMVWYFRRRKWI